MSAPRFLFGALVATIVSMTSTSSFSQLSGASIEAARNYSATHNGTALIVEEGGNIRYEKYYNGYSGEPLHIYSGTKSFFGVLAVIAQEEGLLDLDDRVAETITEWRDDPAKSQITLRETLNFTSGLETGFEEIYGRSSDDKLSVAVGLDAVRPRGSAFIYGPGNINVFCEVLRRKLKSKGMSYEGYLRKKLIHPLNINITRWREDAHGNVVPSAGMYMTGRDWLHFGEMINAGGTWRGKRIVRTESLSQCFSGTRINPSFGLCFWLNGYAKEVNAREMDVEESLEEEPMPEDWSGNCLCADAPVDLICSLGSTFQRLYVVPSMDLIVVHHGKPGHEFRDANFLRILFKDAAVPKPAMEEEKKIRPFQKFLKGLGNR